MERTIEMMTKWLKDSGLTVNETKAEICLFYSEISLESVSFTNSVRIREKLVNWHTPMSCINLCTNLRSLAVNERR